MPLVASRPMAIRASFMMHPPISNSVYHTGQFVLNHIITVLRQAANISTSDRSNVQPFSGRSSILVTALFPSKTASSQRPSLKNDCPGRRPGHRRRTAAIRGSGSTFLSSSTWPLRATAFSSAFAKLKLLSSGRCATTASLGCSNGRAAIAARILVGSGT